MAWFDAGVNLLDPRFEPSTIVSQALAAGVSRMCVIATQPDEWAMAQQLYQQFPNALIYTIGIHPHYAKVVTSDTYDSLISFAQNPGCVAIGECGLDFNRNFSPQDIQRQVFIEQLNIAKQLDKPIYLHERDAFDTQLKCLEHVFAQQPIDGIAHCFTGNAQQLKTYVAKGLYIGITGWLCDHKRGQDLRNAVTHLPSSNLILETDSPYLFPKTVRPRQRNNTPALIPAIAQEYAQITENDLNEIELLSYNNAVSLFRLCP